MSLSCLEFEFIDRHNTFNDIRALDFMRVDVSVSAVGGSYLSKAQINGFCVTLEVVNINPVGRLSFLKEQLSIYKPVNLEIYFAPDIIEFHPIWGHYDGSFYLYSNDKENSRIEFSADEYLWYIRHSLSAEQYLKFNKFVKPLVDRVLFVM